MVVRLSAISGWRWDRLSAVLTVGCLSAFVTGCASSAPSSEASDPGDLGPDVLQASVPATSDPNVLTGDDVRRTGIGNLWDALRRLRPQWMRARGQTSMVGQRAVEPVVYVAGVPHGDLRSLQRMNTLQVRRVEFIDALDATTLFGTGVSGGVIMVDLDRQP